MLLIVSESSYKGRFLERARELIATGGVVGHIHVNGTNYVHCPVCPANFVPPTRQECECCVAPRATHRYEFGVVKANPIYLCDKHLHTFEGFAGTIYEENHNDAWSECPGCKTQCIFEWEK